MPKNFSRSKQIAAQIHRHVASFIQQKMFDPRLRLVTISEVMVSSDLSFARVYFQILKEEQGVEILDVLNQAKGFIRSGLKALPLRILPKLDFCHDTSTVSGFRIETLLNEHLK